MSLCLEPIPSDSSNSKRSEEYERSRVQRFGAFLSGLDVSAVSAWHWPQFLRSNASPLGASVAWLGPLKQKNRSPETAARPHCRIPSSVNRVHRRARRSDTSRQPLCCYPRITRVNFRFRHLNFDKVQDAAKARGNRANTPFAFAAHLAYDLGLRRDIM